MRVSTKRILSIGVAALFLIGALIVYGNLIKPEGEVINEKRALLASKASLFELEKGAVEQVQALISRFQDISAAEEAVSLAIPTDEEVLGALRQIDSAAKMSNVEVVSLSFRILPLATPDQPFLKRKGTLNVTLRAQGNYRDLKRFLEFLERSVRIVSVEGLTMSPGTIADVLDLEINMFYQE